MELSVTHSKRVLFWILKESINLEGEKTWGGSSYKITYKQGWSLDFKDFTIGQNDKMSRQAWGSDRAGMSELVRIIS